MLFRKKIVSIVNKEYAMAETAMNFDYPPGASPAEIWAILRETAESQKRLDLQMKETDRRMEETDRQMKETDRKMKETDRQIKETSRQMEETGLQMKETDRRMKETDKRIGDLSNRFGELAEHLVAPSIREKFNAQGFTFEEVSQNKQIVDTAGNHVAEVDILLENGDTVMVVEIKAKPSEKDVKEHIQRMEILRRRADARNDKRTFQGAIAGAIMGKAVRSHILKNGLYVIEQTGDTVKISIPEGFKARSW